MKDMSSRDKMVLIIITIIIILVAGFFALIRPTYNNYMTDIDIYNSTKAEWDGIDQKIQAIPGLKETITNLYNDASKDAKVFVNEAFKEVNDGYTVEKNNIAVDEHIQKPIDECNLVVRTLSFSGATAGNISFYYYTPNVITYALIESADINGNYAADISELLYTSAVIGAKQSVGVMTNTVSLTARGTRANLMDFLDMIKDDKNALLVNSVNISDYHFSGGLDEEEGTPQPVVPQEPQFDEEGNPIEQPVTPVPTPAVNEEGEQEGFSELTLTITFYNAKAIDEPELGD